MSIAAKAFGGRSSAQKKQHLAAKKVICSQRQAAADAEQQLHSSYLFVLGVLSLSVAYVSAVATTPEEA